MKTQSKSLANNSKELRRKAKARLKKSPGKVKLSGTKAELLKLLEELQIHQIELEIMNEELRDSREEIEKGFKEYTDLYDFAPNGYFTITPDGSILKANQNCAVMLGVERSKLIKRRFKQFVSRESLQTFNETIQKALKGNSKESCDIALSTNNFNNTKTAINSHSGKGQIHYAHIIAEFKKDLDEIRLVLIDITERKQLEKELEYSNIWQETLIQGSRDAIFISNIDSRFILVNQAACELTGYSRNELLQMKIPDLLESTDLKSYLTFHERILAGEEILSEAKILKKNGEKVDTEFNNRRISINNINYVHTSARDVSRRKQTEEAINSSRLFIENIINIIPVRVFWKDKNLRFLGCNKIFADDAGLNNPEDIIGKDDFQMVWRNQAELYRADDLAVINNGKPKLLIEENQTTAEGKQLSLLTSKLPLRNSNGEIIGILGSYIDITERKLVEKALQESEANYKTIFESTGTATLIVDENKIITMANSECFYTTGYKPDELVGMSWTDFVSEESLSEMVKNHEKRRKDPGSAPKKYQVKLIHKNGEARHAVLDIGMIPLTKTSIVSILDITERIIAEEALRQSEEKNRTLITQSPDGIFIVDLSGKFLSVNNSMCEELGFSEEEFLSMNITDIIPENYKIQFETRLKNIINGKGLSEAIDYKVKGKFGRIIYVEVLSAPYYNGNILIGSQSFARNITERIIAEQALRRSREEFRNYFDSSTIGLSVTAPNKSWIEVNQRFCEMMGYSKEEILNYDWMKLTHPDDVTENLKLFEQVLEGKIDSYKIDKRFIRKDGSILYISLSTICQRNADGFVYQFLTSYNDITELKLAEDALIESKNLFKTLTEVSPVGIFRTSPDGSTTYVSPNWCKMSGLSEDAALGEGWLTAVHPKDKDKIKNGWQDATKAHEEFFTDYRLLRPDGTITWVMGQAIPEINSKNQLVGYIGTITDITQRKKAEQEILESRKQMEQLYTHLTDVRENERAEISREIHDQFGQSLTALKFDLNWLADKIDKTPELDSKLKNMVDIVNTTLKDIQRISSDLRPGMLDDLGLISAIQWYSQEFEKRTNVNCHLQLEEIPDMDSKIALALFRVLQEGLTNVIRHANAKNVEIRLFLQSNNVLLKITDDGVGIKSDQINHKNSLGLVGMRERVNQFNGKLEIGTHEKSGTCLTVIIPDITGNKK